MAKKDEGTEFGGDAGLIQPVEKGHVLTPAEKLMKVHQTDPMDAGAYTPDSE